MSTGIIFEKFKFSKSNISAFNDPAKRAMPTVNIKQITLKIIKNMICEKTDLLFKAVPPLHFLTLYHTKIELSTQNTDFG